MFMMGNVPSGVIEAGPLHSPTSRGSISSPGTSASPLVVGVAVVIPSLADPAELVGVIVIVVDVVEPAPVLADVVDASVVSPTLSPQASDTIETKKTAARGCMAPA
jgi:hypothetical protein